VESFVHYVSHNAFIYLGNFQMDSPDELALRLGKRGAELAGFWERTWGLGGLGAIPHILLLETKGNGRAIRVQATQESFQELSEVGEISVLI